MDFLFTVRLGNPEKDLQNCSRDQRSSFCKCKTAVLKDSFPNPFLGFPIESKSGNPNLLNRYLSVEIRFRISRSIANPKSRF